MAAVPEEQHFFLSTVSPDRPQKRLALAVVFALVVGFFVTAGPLTNIQPGRIEAFLPIYGTALCMVNALTAVLLFAQFSMLRSWALLVIATGYLFTALMVIPVLLTFPGVFTPDGLLGAGLQTTNWLYTFWRSGFPLFVIAYALIKSADPARQAWPISPRAAVPSSVLVTAALVGAVTVLVTAGQPYLPVTMLDAVHFSTVWFYIAGCQLLLNVAALILLWTRRRSVLDLCAAPTHSSRLFMRRLKAGCVV